MEKLIQLNAFLKVLKQRHRTIVYTAHSIQRAKMRKFIEDNGEEVKQFEDDISDNKPHVIVEQNSEKRDERKFKLYYQSLDGGFNTYIVSMDGQITLITLYKISKSLQNKVYKYRKRG